MKVQRNEFQRRLDFARLFPYLAASPAGHLDGIIGQTSSKKNGKFANLSLRIKRTRTSLAELRINYPQVVMDNVKPDDAAVHLFAHFPSSTPLFSLGRRTEPDDILRKRVFRHETRKKKGNLYQNCMSGKNSFYVKMKIYIRYVPELISKFLFFYRFFKVDFPLT